MTVLGEDVIIKIDDVDYSYYIYSFKESGGKNIYNIKKTYGNNYVRTYTGKSDYELSFNFRFNLTDFQTIMNKTTPFNIEITMGSEATVTYSNMLPLNDNITSEADGIVEGTLIFSAPGYDSDNSQYNKVIV